MKNTNEQAQREARIKAAVFAAELEATDKQELEECAKDMQKLAELDEDSARIVAAAVRAKTLPNLARQAGLEEEEIERIMKPLHEKPMTADFAKEEETKDPEEEIEEGKVDETENPFEKDEESPKEDIEEASEVNDEEPMAQITIELPASKVQQVEELLQTLQPDFGGESFADGSEAEVLETEPDADDMGSEELPEAKEEEMLETVAQRSNEMDKKTLAERKAQREAILAKAMARTAAEENTDDQERKPKDIGLGKDTSFNGKQYQFDKDAQYDQEEEYPKMTMQNSEGNSLKDNPGYNDIPVPTENPDNLGLKDSYKATKFEGSAPVDGFDAGSEATGMNFDVEFDKLDVVPSAGEGKVTQKFEVPTQLEQRKHKTTVAERVVECEGCNNPKGKPVHECNCEECGTRVAICEDCETEDHCPACAAKTAKKEKESDIELEIPEEKIKPELTSEDNSAEKSAKEAEVYKARLKTAYAVSTQWALAGLITPDEVDDNVDLWMRDNYSVKAMKTNGAILLRTASKAENRVKTAKTEKPTGRQVTAVSTNPSFVTSSVANPAVDDLKQVLQGMFTTVQIDEEN